MVLPRGMAINLPPAARTPDLGTRSDLAQFHAQQLTRRAFLGRASRGLGALGLASLLTPELLRAAAPDKWPGLIHPTHFPAKAKRVIYLCMAGGPSHLETFDFKPKLRELSASIRIPAMQIIMNRQYLPPYHQN